MGLEKQTVIQLDQIIWEDNGGEEDPKSLLIASLRIGTLNMHLEAIAVEEGENGENRAVNIRAGEDLEAYEDAARARFSTLDIDGRDYVLIATPFAR